jgi:hypothetical protein
MQGIQASDLLGVAVVEEHLAAEGKRRDPDHLVVGELEAKNGSNGTRASYGTCWSAQGIKGAQETRSLR